MHGTVRGDILKKILRSTFAGVSELHSRGICHHDLKRSDILLLPSGVSQTIDFGTATKQRPGKKADSYALFQMAYHLSSGQDFLGGAKGMQKVTQKQAEKIQLEKAHDKNLLGILENDPKLQGVDPKLIAVLGKLRTCFHETRISPDQALSMGYFAGHTIDMQTA